MSCELTEIDGSLLEGGGQILRIALTLSAIRKHPVRIIKIRAGRSKPGLMEQHLRGVELLRDLSNAKVIGAQLNSTVVEFWPKQINGGNFDVRVRTAGSISLLLQIALPCILLAKNETNLRLFGGTNVDMAPQIDYMTEVFRPNLEKFGGSFDFDLIKRGYYPKGGGEVVIHTKPVEFFNGINLIDRGTIISIYGWSYVAGKLPTKLSHLMANSAVDILKKFCNKIEIERYKEDVQMAPDNSFGIILVAETSTGCILGSSALGKRNENAEDTGRRAAEELIRSIEQGACVDEHVQDQVIIFMALARGQSRIKVGPITLHTKTAVAIVEQLTDVRFTIIPDGNCNIIECTGAQ